MAPQVPALAQSESKAKFFQRLRFDNDSAAHQQLYRRLKSDAVEGWKRLVQEHTETLTETLTHREILRIYALASAETKAVYDLGRDTETIAEENWVIRWLLWHVFRYRDERNNRGKQRQANSDDDEAPGGEAASGTGSPTTGRTVRTYWDPVRSA